MSTMAHMGPAQSNPTTANTCSLITPGTQPLAEQLYSTSRDESQVLKKYLEDNLSKEFIWASLSPAAAPVLFVTKPEDGLWFCVN